jgi:hypothetical protein
LEVEKDEEGLKKWKRRVEVEVPKVDDGWD